MLTRVTYYSAFILITACYLQTPIFALNHLDPSLLGASKLESEMSKLETAHRHLSSSGSDDGNHSLFHAISSLPIDIGSTSVIIIIAFVLLLGQFFRTLHIITFETSFNKMVSRLEEELMIVGCSAFIFKIIVNTIEITDESWLLSLEYAGKVVQVSLLTIILGFHYFIMRTTYLHYYCNVFTPLATIVLLLPNKPYFLYHYMF